MNERKILGGVLLCAVAGFVAADSPPEAALTVRSAVARAVARAPELAAARAATGASEAAVGEATSPFSPELWLSATPGYSSGLPVAVAARVPAVAGVELRETLLSPERRSESLEAGARRDRSIGEREATAAATAATTIELYSRCWRDQSRLAAARRESEAREALVRSAEASAAAGRLLKIDLERTELEAARARQRLQAIESDLDLGLWELRRRTGWPGAAPILLAEDPLSQFPESAAEDDLPAALARDPQSLALAAQIEELERARDSLTPEWLPVVEAEAQYARLTRANGYGDFYKKFKADDWSVGVSIALPLWNKGRSARQTRMRELAEEARAEQRKREWELDRALRETRAVLEGAISGRALARREEALEGEGLEQSRLLASAGRGEPNAVEKQTIALAQAEEKMARADHELLTARLRLLALRGEVAVRFR